MKSGDSKPVIRRILQSAISIAVAVYLGLGATLFLFQDDFLYHPTKPVTDNKFRHFMVTSDDAQVKVWQANPDKSRALIYFGGNAEDAHAAIEFYEQVLPGHTIYSVNYRGYGGSSGKPSQEALFKDALNVYDHIENNHISISAIGWSLGSGVATFLATQRSIDRLALVTPFDSILEVAKTQYPLYPVSWLLRDTYDSMQLAPAVTSKTLILAAEQDTLIPPSHAYRLASALPDKNTTVITVPWANHFNIVNTEDYMRYMMAFFSL